MFTEVSIPWCSRVNQQAAAREEGTLDDDDDDEVASSLHSTAQLTTHSDSQRKRVELRALDSSAPPAHAREPPP